MGKSRAASGKSEEERAEPLSGSNALCRRARHLCAPAPFRIALRVVVGAVFVYAASDKLLHPARFAEVLMDYEILPPWAINPVAVWLPMVEMITGLSVIAGLWVRANALLMTGLVIVFIGGITTALARGVQLHCGCFSTSEAASLRTWASLWQEAVLLAGCSALYAAHSRAAGSATPKVGRQA